MILLASLGDQPNPNNVLRGHEQAHSHNREPDADFLMQRVSDAWSWLVANALVGPHHRNTSSDRYRVTDRGQQVIAAGSPATLLAEQRLPDDLHQQLEEARSQFCAGKSEIAVFAAMRQVEVRLRELSGAGNDMIGVALARHALKPDGGPLTDDRLETGEREAISHLFAGALGAFKNPTSHRVVDFDDPAVAADVILLADLLMRLLDQRASG
ncbi:MAG: TIGR02391 family protein [Actinomycetota bacterium]|nr:TIGR02391 family protein [Actinomycetota bacterium]